MHAVRSDTEAGANALEYLAANLAREDKAYFNEYLAKNAEALDRELLTYPDRYTGLEAVEPFAQYSTAEDRDMDPRETFMRTKSPAIPITDIVALECASEMLMDRCGGPGDCGRWLSSGFLPFLRWANSDDGIYMFAEGYKLSVRFEGWDTCHIEGPLPTIIRLMNYAIRYGQEEDSIYANPFGRSISEFDADYNGIRLWWD